MNVKFNGVNLLEKIENDGGYSVDLDGNAPKFGYMVAYSGYELSIDKRMLTNDVMSMLEVIYWGNMIDLCQDDIYFGAWYDANTDKVYFDISERIDNKVCALQIAKARKQLAIFDLSTFESIYLD